jgi:hypothetical protein
MADNSAPDLQALNSNPALSDTNYNSQNLEQNSKENKVYSLSKYREKKRLKDIELLQKKHRNEITNLIKSELDKQLIEYKANKEMEDLEKEIDNLTYKSNDNNKYLFSLESNKKEKEKEEETKKKNNESKLNKNEKNNNETIKISEEVKFNPKNLHEDTYLMEQAKKRQLFEINQIKNQKRLERLEKLNIMRNEQIALRKRLESERVNKNLKRNNDDLILRKKYIENKIQYKDLNIFKNKKRKDEKRYQEYQAKNLEEKERHDYIKKLRLSEEKYRENFYKGLLKKDEELKQKKNKNLESNEKPFLKINEMNKLRNDNLNKLQSLIKNGIDENNIKQFYSEFPENKDIVKVFENYQKQKKIIEIDSFRRKEKKRLNPIKPDNSVKRYKTTYDSKNKTLKIPKIGIESKNTESQKFNIKNGNRNQKTDINRNNSNKNNIIPNICSTKNDNNSKNKDNINSKIEIQENKEMTEEKDNIFNNFEVQDDKKDNNNQINTEINNKEKENKDNNIIIEDNIIDNNINSINTKENNYVDNNNNKNIDRSNIHYNETHENFDDIDENNNLNIPNNCENDNSDKKNIFLDKKKVLFETEIRDKIKEYRKTRYQPFMEMLEKEKINEENRNLKLENITDSAEKRQLENLYGKERTVVSLRLKKENEKILRDIQIYEENIRLINQRNQKYNMDRIKIKK